LEANPNPFAIVVMAHLKTQQLRSSNQLLTWKLKLVRMLYERGYECRDVLELFRFLDWLIKLPSELEDQFKEELDKDKEARTMPYVTSVERISRWEGMTDMVFLLLKRRFGELTPTLEQRIKKLSVKQLAELGPALIDFTTVDDLRLWLENQPLVKDRW
jgi:hypothetical protein